MGLEWVFQANEWGSIAEWQATRAYLMQSAAGRKIITAGDALKTKIPIKPNNVWGNKADTVPTTGSTRVKWNPHLGLETKDGGRQTPALGVLHDMDHALRRETDRKGFDRDRKIVDRPYGNREERRVIAGSEDGAARKLGESSRSDHGGKGFFETNSPTSRDSAPSTERTKGSPQGDDGMNRTNASTQEPARATPAYTGGSWETNSSLIPHYGTIPK